MASNETTSTPKQKSRVRKQTPLRFLDEMISTLQDLPWIPPYVCTEKIYPVVYGPSSGPHFYWMRHGGATPDSKERVSLVEIRDTATCPYCWGDSNLRGRMKSLRARAMSYKADLPWSRLAYLWEAAMYALGVEYELAAPDRGEEVGMWSIYRGCENLRRMSAGYLLGGDPRAEGARKHAEHLSLRARTLLGDPSRADEVLQKIRGEVTGGCPEQLLDETETVVAWHDPDNKVGPGSIGLYQRATQTFGVGWSDAEPKRVVVAPRFVVDYILAALYVNYAAKALPRTWVRTEDMTETVLKVAVELWSPTEDGPLRDFREALNVSAQVLDNQCRSGAH